MMTYAHTHINSGLQDKGKKVDLKSMEFDMQLHLMLRHSILHPESILETSSHCRLVWLEHLLR